MIMTNAKTQRSHIQSEKGKSLFQRVSKDILSKSVVRWVHFIKEKIKMKTKDI